MFIASRVTPTAQPRAFASHRASLTVATLALLAVSGSAVTAHAQTAHAQTAHDSAAGNRWEFMASSGALVPTGGQRHVIKDAQLSTAQLSYVVASRVAVTAMAGWARSRDIATSGNPKLDVFTYDVGAELRAPHFTTTTRWSLMPLVGIGVGARSYNYRSRDVDATHTVAAYAAVGGELGASRVRVRLEVRDYVSRFKPLAGEGMGATRNDVVAMLGLRLVRRGA